MEVEQLECPDVIGRIMLKLISKIGWDCIECILFIWRRTVVRGDVLREHACYCFDVLRRRQ